jgi:hypothetical protein
MEGLGVGVTNSRGAVLARYGLCALDPGGSARGAATQVLVAGPQTMVWLVCLSGSFEYAKNSTAQPESFFGLSSVSDVGQLIRFLFLLFIGSAPLELRKRIS